MSYLLTILPPVFNEIKKDFRNANASAYLVGGCVRDYYLRLPLTNIKDIDIEVFGISYNDLHNILSKYGETNIVGESFGVIKTKIGGREYDFSLPRRDSKTGKSHKDFLVEFDPNMTTKKAASRRDFTINSIMMNIENGAVVDYYKGLIDISVHGRLNPTSESFSEDALRILRGLQFSARFGLKPSLDFSKESIKCAADYPKLSRERIWEEWKKFLVKGTDYLSAHETLTKSSLVDLYPELKNIYGLKQDPVMHPEGDVLYHTFCVMQSMHKIINNLDYISEDTRIILMLASLCHDFGKYGKTTEEYSSKHGRIVVKSIGHEHNTNAAKSFMESIGVPKDYVNYVIPLIHNHMVKQKLSNKALRKLSARLYPASIRNLLLLVDADNRGRPPITASSENVLHNYYFSQKLGILDEKPKPIVTGLDLINIGYEPGPQIGNILKHLYKLQLSGAFKDKESGIKQIPQVINLINN